MRIAVLALSLSLAACASSDKGPAQGAPPPAPPQVQQGGVLIGFTGAQLATTFGSPDLRVVEGDGIKQQYRGPCILDVYLYPPRGGRGEPVVMHVDARGPQGNDVDREQCAAVLDQAR